MLVLEIDLKLEIFLHVSSKLDFNFQIAKLLLDNGAVCNSYDTYGHTPLHRAASKGNLKMANLLIVQFKASVNATDNQGNTPLQVYMKQNSFS